MENQFRVVIWSRKPRKSGKYLKISQISLAHLPGEIENVETDWKNLFICNLFVDFETIILTVIIYLFFAGIDCVAFIDCIFAKILMYYCIFIPCNFTKNNIRPWVFLKFYITQMVPNGAKRLICNLRALVYRAV